MTDGRGAWLKSKSLREVSEDRDVFTDVGPVRVDRPLGVKALSVEEIVFDELSYASKLNVWWSTLPRLA